MEVRVLMAELSVARGKPFLPATSGCKGAAGIVGGLPAASLLTGPPPTPTPSLFLCTWLPRIKTPAKFLHNYV